MPKITKTFYPVRAEWLRFGRGFGFGAVRGNKFGSWFGVGYGDENGNGYGYGSGYGNGSGHGSGFWYGCENEYGNKIAFDIPSIARPRRLR